MAQVHAPRLIVNNLLIGVDLGPNQRFSIQRNFT